MFNKILNRWGAETEAANVMVNNPFFTVLRTTSNANALVLFSDDIHGVFLCADVDAAYRWIGPQRQTLAPCLPAK